MPGHTPKERNRRRRRLTRLKVNEISFVDQGANPGAHVLLFKRGDNVLPIDFDKQTKTEDGVSFPAGAFAFVPDGEKPSTWKLRLWETPAKKETRAQVGRAVAALGPRGFRGNRVSIPSDALAGVKRKVLRAWLKTHPDQTREDAPRVLKRQALRDLVDFVNDLGFVISKQEGDPEPRSFDEIRDQQHALDVGVAIDDRIRALSISVSEALFAGGEEAEQMIKESVQQFSSSIDSELADLMAGRIVKVFEAEEDGPAEADDVRDEIAQLLSVPEGDGGIDMKKIDLTKIPEDIRGSVEAALAAATVAEDLYAKLCESNLKLEEGAAALAKAKEKAKPPEKDDVTKGMTKEQRTAFDAEREKTTVLAKRVDEMEKKERRAEIRARVAKLTALAKSADDVVDLLEPLDEKTRVALEALLSAANEAAARGGLGNQIGTERGGDGMTAYAKMEEAATAIRDKRPDLTREGALRAVMTERPELYEAYLEEERQGQRAH